ncbi:hypothetical protein HEP81_07991 (plasmid) [Streptomyces griseofuscus]|uniref:Uncharacterized protein n=1 Tax=Streptomyces griseofuscus TaxID=146922 RepID=A0A7H1QD39_9ACTN|nr:hypothetical protein HEP81_07991 [Streptomyces griseofuscus]
MGGVASAVSCQPARRHVSHEVAGMEAGEARSYCVCVAGERNALR